VITDVRTEWDRFRKSLPALLKPTADFLRIVQFRMVSTRYNTVYHHLSVLHGLLTQNSPRLDARIRTSFQLRDSSAQIVAHQLFVAIRV
jgi:hypothetical protein